MSGLPTETLVGILKEHSLFKQLREAGRTATFANPFTEDYFAAVEAGRWRHSSSTTAVLSADLPVRMLNDFCNGEAVFHDVTGEGLPTRLRRHADYGGRSRTATGRLGRSLRFYDV